MAKMYFCKELEEVNSMNYCMELDKVKEELAELGYSAGNVCLAEKDTSSLRYCLQFGNFFDKRDFVCGDSCEEYAPQNGFSGKCIHSTIGYEPDGEWFEIEVEL